jgi:hypothetical protein
MTGLPTTFLTARLAQATRHFLVTVTGRWFATVAAIFGYLVLQRFNPLLQHLDGPLLLLQNVDPIRRKRRYQSDNCVFTIDVGPMYLFSTRQAQCFHTYILAETYDLDNRTSTTLYA